MSVLAWILINGVVLASAYLLNDRIIRFPGKVPALIALFVLYFTQIVLTELILGMAGALNLANVAAFNLIILAAVFFSFRGSPGTASFAGLKADLDMLIRNKAALFIISVISAFALVAIAVNLVNPPFGWDNLSYHFAFPVEWLKSGNLSIAATICDDPSPPYYPINGSLFFLWFMLPLKNVFLADLGQVPFFVLAFLSVFGISRRLKLPVEHSFYAASLFIITPNVFKQLGIAYVDVMFAALFLSAVYFLAGFANNRSFKDLFLWALTFGLFCGVKTSAIVYGILPALFFIFILCCMAGARETRFKALVFLLTFAAVVMISGGFSYVRNAALTGNPIFPAHIKLLGHTIFKGVMPFATYRAQWTSEEINLGKALFGEGLGAQLILIFIPAVLISIPVALLKNKGRISAPLLFVLALPPVLFASFVYLMPQLWIRYLYPFFGIGYVVAVYTLSSANLPVKALRALAVICVVTSSLELMGWWRLISALLLAAILFLTLPGILKLRFSKRTLIIASLFLTGIMVFLNADYNKHEFERYLNRTPYPREDREAWAWLNDNTARSRIAYAGIPHVLPLYGSKFKNDVYYVSVNETDPAPLYLYPNGSYQWDRDFLKMYKRLESPGNYRENPDYGIWLNNLKKRRIQYLVVYSLRKIKDSVVFPLENDWALAHPEEFTPVFNKRIVNIYRVLK